MGQLPRCQGVCMAPARGMSLLGLSPQPRAHPGGRGACAPNNSHSGEAKRNFQEERAPQAPASPGATLLRASRWPQVPPPRERRRALGPGTRGGCVPAAPAAFQEQYCWHQAGSPRRQRIHRPFMRGARMIYCLGEGAGAGGWSPRVPAPSSSCCGAPTRVVRRLRVSPGVTSPHTGMGQSEFPCPFCPVPAHSLTHLQGPGDTLCPWYPAASELPPFVA